MKISKSKLVVKFENIHKASEFGDNCLICLEVRILIEAQKEIDQLKEENTELLEKVAMEHAISVANLKGLQQVDKDLVGYYNGLTVLRKVVN